MTELESASASEIEKIDSQGASTNEIASANRAPKESESDSESESEWRSVRRPS